MRNRVLLAAGTVAVFVPALLFAQQRPAPRREPEHRREEQRAAQPVRPLAYHLEQTWELSAGVGVFGAGAGLSGTSSKQFMPGGMLRVGYNLNTMWNISVGSGFGFGKSSIVSLTGYATPSALVTWTPDINEGTSPFVDAGIGMLYRKNPPQNNTAVAGQVGVGLRHMIGDALALRVEGGVLVGKMNSTTTGAGFATVGLSFFVGGRQPVSSVGVTPRTVALASLGATQQLFASPMDRHGRPLAGRAVTWSSGNSSIATVSSTGLVTARSNGSATITAASEAGTGSVSVSVAQTAAILAVAPTSGALTAVGQTQQFTASARDANNNPFPGAVFSWASSDPSVASVSGSGVASAVRNGTARITATSGGRSASATVTVAQTTMTVALTPATTSFSTEGATAQLAAQALDANGNAIAGKTFSWTSDAPGVATVSQTGFVTAVANGVAHIGASVDGSSASATVTVILAARGVPAVALPATNASMVLRNVTFRINSAVLLRATKSELDKIAIAIQGVPNARWEIGGYTSNTGRVARNVRLSGQRADAVKNYLVSRGVEASSLTAVGYGPRHPVASNRTAKGRALNMRVEIKRLQ